jgi:hypothetical protein
MWQRDQNILAREQSTKIAGRCASQLANRFFCFCGHRSNEETFTIHRTRRSSASHRRGFEPADVGSVNRLLYFLRRYVEAIANDYSRRHHVFCLGLGSLITTVKCPAPHFPRDSQASTRSVRIHAEAFPWSRCYGSPGGSHLVPGGTSRVSPR